MLFLTVCSLLSGKNKKSLIKALILHLIMLT
nr:MAG TPA: hypothetical protein [Caudoviricetes sp.]